MNREEKDLIAELVVCLAGTLKHLGAPEIADALITKWQATVTQAEAREVLERIVEEQQA